MLAGDYDKAQALFDRVVAVANDFGLLAEEFDTVAGRQTGNFPQALTHIALINTAHNLSAAKAVGREAGDAAVEVKVDRAKTWRPYPGLHAVSVRRKMSRVGRHPSPRQARAGEACHLGRRATPDTGPR